MWRDRFRSVRQRERHHLAVKHRRGPPGTYDNRGNGMYARPLELGPEQTQPSNALVLQIELKLSRDANPDGLIHPRPGAARGSMNSRAGKECRRGLQASEHVGCSVGHWWKIKTTSCV